MIPDHSNIWDRLSAQLKEKYPDKDTRQMAKDILIKRGHLTEDGKLTPEGEARSSLGAEGRAIDRAQKRSGTGKQYSYDPNTNRTRVVSSNMSPLMQF